jgi:hypothetical protein
MRAVSRAWHPVREAARDDLSDTPGKWVDGLDQADAFQAAQLDRARPRTVYAMPR